MLNFNENKDFPQVLLSKGAINDLENVIMEQCESFADVLFVSDEKILRNSRRFLPINFLKNVKKKLILKTPYASDEYSSLIKNQATNIKMIIGFGSGTINDLCKISAKELGINYIIIASAASMNGYLSKNASISINGHKKTLSATLPKVVICDLDILKSAPKRLTKAGVGDSLCFYSCWFDWYLSHKILGTKFDKNLFLMLQGKVDFLLQNYQKFDLDDDALLEILIEILLISGWSMTLAGGSYPASQSEHLISHVMEMKYGSKLRNSLHGLQIALTTLSSAKIQKEILKTEELLLRNTAFPEQEMVNFFNKNIAAQCKLEYSKKIFTKEKLSEINENLSKRWVEIRSELQDIYINERVIRDIFQHFTIKSYPSAFEMDKSEYEECVKYAKFIRDRFTCLDLNQILIKIL